MPVLAEEAIGRATHVEHREIVLTGMLTPLTDPIGDTVRGQRIAIPMQQALLGRPSKMRQSAVARRPQSAIAAFTLADDALIAAGRTANATRVPRRLGGQVELGT
jgi:hypothetical protein